MTTHIINLARHTAQVVGLAGVLVLGTRDSYGTEQLLLRPGPEWDGLAIDATFHNVSGDEGVTVLADTDGLVPVPPEACMRAYAVKTIEGWGCYAMVYTYLYYSRTELDMTRLAKYDLWIAHYAAACGYKGSYGMWQYTSSGNVAGVSGKYDCNYAYKDYPAIIKGAGLNGYGKTSVKPADSVWDSDGPFVIAAATGQDKAALRELCEEKELTVSKG